MPHCFFSDHVHLVEDIRFSFRSDAYATNSKVTQINDSKSLKCKIKLNIFISNYVQYPWKLI